VEEQYLDYHKVHICSGAACVLVANDYHRPHSLNSVDYLFSSNGKGSQFIDEIQGNRLMTQVGFEKFAYRNTESLLKIKQLDGFTTSRDMNT
jgi:hypothetical protein